MATNRITNDLGATVTIKSVNFKLFNKANINEIFIADKNKDTILYAGNLNIKITDWFFLKNIVELEYIELNDAKIKINRNDSIWNYQFLINHFVNPNSTNKKSNTALGFKKIHLSNFELIQNDNWRGELLTVKANKFLIDIDSINLLTNRFIVNDVVINSPQISIQKFNGNRPMNYVAALVDDSKIEHPLFFKVNEVNITNGDLTINNNYKKAVAHFDGDHILFKELNATFKSIRILKDSLSALININAKERSGLVLKELSANVFWAPKILELSNLNLRTNKSHLTNYYAMKFKNFNDDFAEYESMVTMEARFKNSILNSDDVAFFSPDLKNWKKELLLSGDFYGTTSNFKFNNFFGKEKNNATTISGDLTMKGLPDINKTIIGFKNGNIKTNAEDLSAIIPSLKNVTNPNLKELGTILFKGNFNGTTSKFITNATISTNLGKIVTNLNMELPEKKDAIYKGSIDMINFELGKFLKDSKLGIVDFTGNFNGKSFNVDKLNTKIDGNFKTLNFNGYAYSNIITNGEFKNKYFKGELKINDANFHLNGHAEANFSTKIPKFNILADITKSKLKPLNFFKEDFNVTGLLDVYFAGTNIDNFIGTAKFLNATLSNNNGVINFDSLTLTTSYIDSIKHLHFATNDFSANVKGNFTILDLPNSFQSFLHNYYPSYISEPTSIPQSQNFVVNINTQYIEPYLKFFDNNFRGFNDASLTGTINTNNNLFELDVLLPFGKYKKLSITGAELKGKGNRDTLVFNGQMSDFSVSDSLSFPNTKLSVQSHNDLSNISIITKASNTLNEANLNAQVKTSPNGVKIKFNPSSFILNDKKWHLEKEGEISLTKNLVEAKNVKFVQGFQEITLETSPDEGGNTSSLDIKLKNVVAGDISSLFLKDLRLEGIANGSIHVDDIFGKLNATADFKVEQFRIDSDSIGVAYIKANYNSRTGAVMAKVDAPNKSYNFSIDGIINTKDTTENFLNTTLNLNNSRIDIVQKLIGNDVFSNLKGFATGKLLVKGKSTNPSLSGNVKLQNAGLKVNFTQVYYLIDSANISFENDGIDFHEFNIKDTLGNIGIVKGKLYEKNFKKLTFDFDLSTNKLLLINTTYKDNSQFYGNAIGKANLSFKGPEDNCKMVITGEPTDKSHITIPNSESKETSEASFIVFKPIGEEIFEAKKQGNFNLSVNLDLTVNNKVDFEVILDEITGDVIKAKGNGRLKIKAGTSESLDMRGKYNIEEGSYDFNFQSFIRKPFVLKKADNNFIEWSGDPFDAYMHIEAIYEAKNISIKELIGPSTAFNSSSRTFRDDVYVIATLSGKLMKPEIKFRFDFPPNSPIKNDDVFDRFRKKIESDENEMIKQVTYLIVFNSFAPYGEASVAQTNFTSIGVNTISAMLTKEINNTFTNLLYKITKDKSIAFDLSSAVYSSNDLFSNGNVSATSTQFDRYNLKFKVGKSFFSDRVRFTFGSDFDINLRSSAQAGNFQWLPDWNVEWGLNNEKNLSLLIFSKNSLDISGNTLGRRNRQGIGITYKKDFDNSPFEKKNSIEFKSN